MYLESLPAQILIDQLRHRATGMITPPKVTAATPLSVLSSGGDRMPQVTLALPNTTRVADVPASAPQAVSAPPAPVVNVSVVSPPGASPTVAAPAPTGAVVSDTPASGRGGLALLALAVLGVFLVTRKR